MKNITYSKSGAIVSVSQNGNTHTYNIKKGEQILDISFTRRQKTEKREGAIPMGHIKVPAIVGEHIALYDVGVRIGGEERSFSVSLVANRFHIPRNNREPEHKIDFEKGIPPKEYADLCKKLSKQNVAVAQVMENYVLDAEGLQKCNNIQQSTFNQKLHNFLSGGKI